MRRKKRILLIVFCLLAQGALIADQKMAIKENKILSKVPFHSLDWYEPRSPQQIIEFVGTKTMSLMGSQEDETVWPYTQQCYQILEDLKQGKAKIIEPVLRTENKYHPAFAKYNACKLKLQTTKPRAFYGMASISKYDLRLYELGVQVGPDKTEIVEMLYSEQSADQYKGRFGQPSGYNIVNPELCLFEGGVGSNAKSMRRQYFKKDLERVPHENLIFKVDQDYYGGFLYPQWLSDDINQFVWIFDITGFNPKENKFPSGLPICSFWNIKDFKKEKMRSG